MNNHEFAKLSAGQAAPRIWNRMTADERKLVRFGLFPAWIRKEPEDGHELVCALMNLAEKNGGMIA